MAYKNNGPTHIYYRWFIYTPIDRPLPKKNINLHGIEYLSGNHQNSIL